MTLDLPTIAILALKNVQGLPENTSQGRAVETGAAYTAYVNGHGLVMAITPGGLLGLSEDAYEQLF
jgi:hypothetical protein